MDIHITPKAHDKIAAYLEQQDGFLRVSVVSGGCSGMTYDAVIDSELRDGDEVIYEDQAVRVVSDPRSSLFLDGLAIDFSDDLIQAGFRLTNSNATKSCGCGSSFAV